MKLPANASIVILTGARISAGSDISTFRDAKGLWEQHRIEDVATSEGFEKDPTQAQVEVFINDCMEGADDFGSEFLVDEETVQ